MAISANSKTIYYLIALLKEYGLKYIVASPGMQNSKFNAMVQEDKSFQCYSVVDERSAGYFAIGISNETQQPVAITCTGATASRNYLSAMTEAYYRQIPIIAITFFNYNHNDYNLSPQYVDRSLTQNDCKYISVNLPRIFDIHDKQKVLTLINTALFYAFFKKLPIHINCPSSFEYKDDSEEFPKDIWKPRYYHIPDDTLKAELKSKNFAVFIGSHRKFSEKEIVAISKFVQSYDAPVICDHTSNYIGNNKLLIPTITSNLEKTDFPEVIIDIGEISGEYSNSALFANSEIWRVSKDFKVRSNKPLKKFFDCDEESFFTLLNNNKKNVRGYYTYLKEKIDSLKEEELPLCNAFICKNLAKHIPNNSSLHLSILNALRSMNYFELDNSINVSCNVGGFGIDGPLSTTIGQSMANPNKKTFAIIGDLAFFYDMNALGLRHIGKNLRLIIVNNNRGEEFRINPLLEANLGEKTDVLIAAAGHYRSGAKAWAISCGFEYLEANSKDEFLNLIQDFCMKEYNKPVLFEVKTSNSDEKNGISILTKKKIKEIKKETLTDKIKKILKV